jgi:hypothetical protein
MTSAAARKADSTTPCHESGEIPGTDRKARLRFRNGIKDQPRVDGGAFRLGRIGRAQAVPGSQNRHRAPELGRKTFRFLLKENAMATEKLSDGIRKLTSDTAFLEQISTKDSFQSSSTSRPFEVW